MRPVSTLLTTWASKGRPAVHNNLSSVSQILDRLSCQSLFLVADPITYKLTGAKSFLSDLSNSRRVTVFQDFRPNPTLDELLRGIRSYADAQPDVTLVIGGGSAIDLAKLIGFCAAQSMLPREVVLAVPSDAKKGIPLIAVPTTAGTGSEATHFAVVYVDGQKFFGSPPFDIAGLRDPRFFAD